MSKIKLFHPLTYPNELLVIRSKLQELPHDLKNSLYLTNNLPYDIYALIDNNKTPLGILAMKISNILESCEMVVYHNTRLFDKENIQNHGLIFSDERYIQSLKRGMYANHISSVLTEKVINAIIDEQERWNSNRKNAVCFIYNMDDYMEYNKFLAIYGGEFMEYALYTIRKDLLPSQYRDILKLGKPYIIEFSIPFTWFDASSQKDIIKHILEYWICLDIRNEEPPHNREGRIEHEIPPEKIIKIHEIKDEFPEVDDWLFYENE